MTFRKHNPRFQNCELEAELDEVQIIIQKRAKSIIKTPEFHFRDMPPCRQRKVGCNGTPTTFHTNVYCQITYWNWKGNHNNSTNPSVCNWRATNTSPGGPYNPAKLENFCVNCHLHSGWKAHRQRFPTLQRSRPDYAFTTLGGFRVLELHSMNVAQHVSPACVCSTFPRARAYSRKALWNR